MMNQCVNGWMVACYRRLERVMPTLDWVICSRQAISNTTSHVPHGDRKQRVSSSIASQTTNVIVFPVIAFIFSLSFFAVSGACMCSVLVCNVPSVFFLSLQAHSLLMHLHEDDPSWFNLSRRYRYPSYSTCSFPFHGFSITKTYYSTGVCWLHYNLTHYVHIMRTYTRPTMLKAQHTHWAVCSLLMMRFCRRAFVGALLSKIN